MLIEFYVIRITRYQTRKTNAMDNSKEELSENMTIASIKNTFMILNVNENTEYI